MALHCAKQTIDDCSQRIDAGSSAAVLLANDPSVLTVTSDAGSILVHAH